MSLYKGHLSHLEELIFINGSEGLKLISEFLNAFIEDFGSNSKTKYNVSVKVDGAPSLYFGIDPADDKFFVSTKTIFSKEPKLIKSDSDLNEYTGDLKNKLKASYDNLSKIGMTKSDGIINGDFLFLPSDLKVEIVDDQELLTFQPNTIIYASEVGSDISNKIEKSSMGIALHTRYKVSSLDQIPNTSPDKDLSKYVNELNSHTNVYAMDTSIQNLAGNITLTEKESKAILNVSNILDKISSANLDWNDVEKISPLILKYGNSVIRSNNYELSTTDFLKWLKNSTEKAADKLKTDKAKDKKWHAYYEIEDWVNSNKTLEILFDAYNAVYDVKIIINNLIHNIDNFKTYVRHTKDGLRVTSGEGFVISDVLNGNTFKIVDRLEFSFNNFSSEITKGFETPEMKNKSVNESNKSDNITTAVVTYGRFNPFTKGHLKMVEQMNTITGETVICTSMTHDKIKNPLKPSEKKQLIEESLKPSMYSEVILAKTVIVALQEVNKRYKNITCVFGPDRVTDMEKLILKYNNVDYTFDNIKIIGVEGFKQAEEEERISATKVRQACLENDFDTFVELMSPNLTLLELEYWFKLIKERME